MVFYVFANFRNKIEIFEIGKMHVGKSRLTHAVNFSRTAEFEVNLGEFESVVGLLHGTESFVFVFFGREEIAVRLVFTSSDASSELVELRESEPF